MYSSNVSQLVVANLDIARFTAVNTAKGSWSLLDLLSSTGDSKSEICSPVQEAQPPPSTLSLAEIQGIVREVATAIIGEALEGDQQKNFKP